MTQPQSPYTAAKDMRGAAAFQDRVFSWLLACFGPEIAADKIERNHRFLEEALELVQSCDCTQSEAHQLVDYVYGRETGDKGQEIGGVMNTLAGLCCAHGFDMMTEGDREIERCWAKIDKIRAKWAAKPKHSPLPAAPSEPTAADATEALNELDAIYNILGNATEPAAHQVDVLMTTLEAVRAEIARMKAALEWIAKPDIGMAHIIFRQEAKLRAEEALKGTSP